MPQQLHSFAVTVRDPFATFPIDDQLDLRFDAAPTARRIWPVRALVAQVRELVEQEHGDIWVEGEISNFRPAPSGHVYFTLKDATRNCPPCFSGDRPCFFAFALRTDCMCWCADE